MALAQDKGDGWGGGHQLCELRRGRGGGTGNALSGQQTVQSIDSAELECRVRKQRLSS